MTCVKAVTRDILNTLIDESAKYVYDVVNDKSSARGILSMRTWWVRGFDEIGVLPKATTLENFKKYLRWTDADMQYIDMDGLTMLMFATINSNVNVVREILKSLNDEDEDTRKRVIEMRTRREGYMSLGIPGHTNALFGAMAWGTPEIVELLMEAGADPNVLDQNSADPFMYASFYGRVLNMKIWLQRVQNWDLNRCNKATGANALTLALSQGPNKQKTLEFLLKAGMNGSFVAASGTTNLIAVCGNVDSDPEIVEMILDLTQCDINERCRPRSLRWKAIRYVCKFATLTGVAARNGMMPRLAYGLGATALHYAARLGDLERVELLLGNGADPTLKNYRGDDAGTMSKNFQELRGILQKRQRMERLKGQKKTKAVEVLGKRISTATPVQHKMYLISLETLLMLYGSKSKYHVMEVHQHLKSGGFLCPWEDVPGDAEIVFVSHEWLSWAHPDPKGEQLRVLCCVLERLKKGELDTEMDPFHTILYKHKFTTKGKDWNAMLKRTYLWIDWISMPQPGAEKEKEIGKEKLEQLRLDGSNSIQSIPAYVERSDFIMVLVPGCYHSDRRSPTCFRSWRRRGWCLLELYASAMARDSSNPPLLVRSERGTPMWMSPLEILKLSIGLADFTCCQRNHVITTETQKIISGGKVKKIPCDKPIAGGILEQLIDAKINHLFNAECDFVMARLYSVLKHWWMRGISVATMHTPDKDKKNVISKFKKKLRWGDKDNKEWFDRGGIGILFYAVMSNQLHVVNKLLCNLQYEFEVKMSRLRKGNIVNEYSRRLDSCLSDNGYIVLGLPGKMTTLMAAMAFASPEIVSMLLECGANVETVDVMGNDAFMFASIFGQPKNLQCWLNRVNHWDLNRQNTVVGGCALGMAAFMSANKLDTVKVLIKAGAYLEYQTFTGGNVISAAVANEDAEPEVVKLVLEELKLNTKNNTARFMSLLNYKHVPTTVKWRCIYFAAKTFHRIGMSHSQLVSHLAVQSGTTPLNLAVIRGDAEIVKILLEAGANPYVENDLGMNAFEICEKFGPFPRVLKTLKKHLDKITSSSSPSLERLSSSSSSSSLMSPRTSSSTLSAQNSKVTLVYVNSSESA